MKQRSFHIVDVENLCGSGQPRPATVRAMFERYGQAAGMQAEDHGVASVNRSVLPCVLYELVHQLRWIPAGTGCDAADRALLEAVDEALLARRYRRVVIGSGDHAFAPLAERLVSSGIQVTVVARKGAVNWKLYRSSTGCTLLKNDDFIEVGIPRSTLALAS